MKFGFGARQFEFWLFVSRSRKFKLTRRPAFGAFAKRWKAIVDSEECAWR